MEGTDKSSLWRDHFACKVYRPCLGMTVTGERIHKNRNLSCFTCLSGSPLANCASLYLSRKLIDRAYSPFHAVLHCGNLSSDVQVFPRPEPVVVDEEVEPMPLTVNTGTLLASNFIVEFGLKETNIHSVIHVSDLEIVGFIEIADISSPPVISRHLVLPIAVNKGLC